MHEGDGTTDTAGATDVLTAKANTTSNREEIARAFTDYDQAGGYRGCAQCGYAKAYNDVLLAREGFYEAADDASQLKAVESLAEELVKGLRKWGLQGGHRTPIARSREDIVPYLLTEREALKRLAALSQEPPRLVDGKRFVPGGQYTPDELDAEVTRLLVSLAEGLFVGCTQATYSMKALLLLTGYTVAFDRHVRSGAALGGFTGMEAQFQIAAIRDSSTSAAARKIVALPYILGSLWYAERALFEQVIEAVRCSPMWAALATQLYDVGRFFDIQFFMQGKDGRLLLQLERSGPGYWYKD